MISLLIALIVIGAVLYLVEAYVPMPAPFKMLVRVVGVIIVVIYLLRFAGLWPAP